MKVRLIINKSHVDMTFEKEDDELVDLTVKWIEKKLRIGLEEMKSTDE